MGLQKLVLDPVDVRRRRRLIFAQAGRELGPTAFFWLVYAPTAAVGVAYLWVTYGAVAAAGVYGFAAFGPVVLGLVNDLVALWWRARSSRRPARHVTTRPTP